MFFLHISTNHRCDPAAATASVAIETDVSKTTAVAAASKPALPGAESSETQPLGELK